MNTLINRVEDAINAAESGRTKLTADVLAMEGMSAKKNRILLNELVKDDTRYLEVGVFKGSTFIAALFNNTPEYAVAIDNFAQFNSTETIFRGNCERFGIEPNFINADCFALTPEQKASIKNITIYFYDGDHREEDQERALTYYTDCLADTFIYICDDWNWTPCKTGTRKALDKLALTVHREWELPARTNGDREQWWNGLYVAVVSKP